MDYIKNIRRFIGNDTLLTIGCGVLIENESGSILLQHRKDSDVWGIPGGLMELGETFHETAIREVQEETGLLVEKLELFGLYSGRDYFVHYPNGDRTYSVQIIFLSRTFSGSLQQDDAESRAHFFFSKDKLPVNINPTQERFIRDWAEGVPCPVIV